MDNGITENEERTMEKGITVKGKLTNEELQALNAEPGRIEVLEFDPEALAKQAAFRLDRHDRFLKVFYAELDISCIDMFAGKARWNWQACNRAINVFGITVKVLSQAGKPYYKDKFEDTEWKYYIFCHHAEASYELSDGRVLAVTVPGYFSTRDPFFGKAHGGFKPIEVVDVQDVIRASATEARKKAVFALLGLGEPTKDDLKKLGVKVDIINTIEFKTTTITGEGAKNAQSKSQPQPPEKTPTRSPNLITEAQAKNIFKKLKDTPFTVGEFMIYLRDEHKLEQDADGKIAHKITKKQYDLILVWLDENKKDE